MEDESRRGGAERVFALEEAGFDSVSMSLRIGFRERTHLGSLCWMYKEI